MQQHGRKYFARRHPTPPHPRDWVNRSNSTFSVQSHDAYQIKENKEYSYGVNQSNSTFSEHGHDAYQIKENHKCSNMEANILP